MKLYEISDEIERILAQEVDRETGEITDETLAKLEELEMARSDKALAVAAYMKGEQVEGEAVKLEADRLNERAKRHQRRADRLKQYLEQFVPEGSDFHDARSTIKWKKNPPSCEITDQAALPRIYIATVPATERPDKKAILAALKNGKEIAGAKLIDDRRRLEVK